MRRLAFLLLLGLVGCFTDSAPTGPEMCHDTLAYYADGRVAVEAIHDCRITITLTR
jgi:hypothetical protein